ETVRLNERGARGKGASDQGLQFLERLSDPTAGRQRVSQKAEREKVVTGRLFDAKAVAVKLPWSVLEQHLPGAQAPAACRRKVPEPGGKDIQSGCFADQMVIGAGVEREVLREIASMLEQAFGDAAPVLIAPAGPIGQARQRPEPRDSANGR